MSEARGWRPGRRIGLDVGGVRVGVATCDPHGMLATPVETIQRGRGDVARVLDLVTEHDAVELVVGLPRHLSGASGVAVDKAIAFARDCAREAAARGVDLSVRLVDERLSTVSADRVLADRGHTAKARRSIIDQAAATVILQQAIDTERATGEPAGDELEDHL